MKPLRLAVLMGCLTLPVPGFAQEQVPSAAPVKTGAPAPAQARATTIQNLRAASQGEADAVQRYELFAQRAEQDGYPQVAKLFRAAAVSERIHLRNHQLVLQALGEKPAMPTPARVEVRTTRENLLVPIEGERGEATQTYPRYARQAEAAGIPAAGGAGASMDLKDMPEPVREIMRAAYGDATAQIFMVSAIIGVVALVAILFIKEEPLRRTVDIVTPSAKGEDKHDDGGPATESGAAAGSGPAAGTGIVDLDREFVQVLSQQRESQRRAP